MSQPVVSAAALMRPRAAEVEIAAEWLCEPIPPCGLLPNGACGLLLVTDLDEGTSRAQVATTYAVTVLGKFYKRRKEAEVLGFRLLTPGKGEAHDVDPHGDGGPTCTCGSFLAQPNRRLGCRHIHGLRLAGVPEIPMLERTESNAIVGDGFDDP